ncbi:hypothetical protein ACWEIJ_36685 [Lentzea sp. NPDC004789]
MVEGRRDTEHGAGHHLTAPHLITGRNSQIGSRPSNALLLPNSGSVPAAIAACLRGELVGDLHDGLVLDVGDLDAAELLAVLHRGDEEDVGGLTLVLPPERHPHPQLRHLHESVGHRTPDEVCDRDARTADLADVVEVGEQRGRVEVQLTVELGI